MYDVGLAAGTERKQPATVLLRRQTMDEVKAMTRAGEAVGTAVGTGLQTAREGAIRAGHKGANVSSRAARKAEGKLAERGFAPQQLQDAITENAEQARKGLDRTREELRTRTKQARKEFAKSTKQTRKEFAKNAKRARKELAAKIEPSERGKRRWPWLLVLLVAGAGVAAYVLSRRPQEMFTADDDALDDPLTSPQVAEAGNGRHSN